MSFKTYLEVSKYRTFEERFNYLKLYGTSGKETFGIYRYLNQKIYRSVDWKNFKRKIILRDAACDLGIIGMDIHDRIIVHHINPISMDDVINNSNSIFDPNNVICTSLNTHNLIHYTKSDMPANYMVIRTQNDTCPWRK